MRCDDKARVITKEQRGKPKGEKGLLTGEIIDVSVFSSFTSRDLTETETTQIQPLVLTVVAELRMKKGNRHGVEKPSDWERRREGTYGIPGTARIKPSSEIGANKSFRVAPTNRYWV